MADFQDGKFLTNWALTGSKTAPTQPKRELGWIFKESPPHDTQNYIEYERDGKINNILRRGVGEWHADNQYLTGSIVFRNGVVYRALSDNIGVDPVSINTSWIVFRKEVTAGSSAITINTNSSTNVSTIDVSGSGLFGKFDNTEQITFSTSGNNLKANFNSRDVTEVTAAFTTLTAADANRTFYVAASGGNPQTKVFNLPPASSVDNNWKVWVNAIQLDRGALSFFPNGTDKLTKDGKELNAEVRIQNVVGALYCIYKIKNSNVFVIAGDDKSTITPFTANNQDTILSRQHNGNIIFQKNSSGSSGNIYLPNTSSLPDAWSVKICVENQSSPSAIQIATGSSDLLSRGGATLTAVQIYAGTNDSILEVIRVPGQNRFVVAGAINASRFEDYGSYPIAIAGGSLYTRGYHIANDVLIQYGFLVANQSISGDFASRVDVPLLIPCSPSTRYGTYVSIRDDSFLATSATYSNQPVTYSTDVGSQGIRIHSYYNSSNIGINFMVVSQIPNTNSRRQ